MTLLIFLFWFLLTREEKGILDESYRFMKDPVAFTSEITKNGSLPSHVVLFGSEEILLRDLLKSYSFREVRAKTYLLRIVSLYFILFISFSTVAHSSF